VSAPALRTNKEIADEKAGPDTQSFTYNGIHDPIRHALRLSPGHVERSRQFLQKRPCRRGESHFQEQARHEGGW
jgi:hypothetical protein